MCLAHFIWLASPSFTGGYDGEPLRGSVRGDDFVMLCDRCVSLGVRAFFLVCFTPVLRIGMRAVLGRVVMFSALISF